MLQKRVVTVVGAATLGLGLVGCSQPTSPATRSAAQSAPPCAGVATGEYGVGDAVHRSVPALAALPTRFSTGTATATAGGSGKLLVEVHLCGRGASLDATKDAATVVAHEVAVTATLGSRVEKMTVLNPATGQQITAEPFDSAAFAADGAASVLRGRWYPAKH